jgi:hypothetical protein
VKKNQYALQGMGWTDMYDLPPYVDRYWLIHLGTLTIRRSDACVIVFNVLSGWVGSPSIMSLVNVVAPRYRTRGGDFFRIDFHALTTAFTNHFICQGNHFLIV